MFILILLSTGSLLFAQGSATVAFTPLVIDAGSTGTVEAHINCPSVCSLFTVDLSFDPAVIRVDAVEVGPYLGTQVIVSESAINNNAGTVRLQVAALDTPPANVGNVLFTMAVTGAANGTSPITVNMIEVVDSAGTALPSVGEQGVVVVGELAEGVSLLDPTWELAFTSERDGNREIYRTNVSGSSQRRLTDNPAVDEYPAWSPDGGRIAFVSDRDGNSELYVMNADGSGVQRLTDNPAVDEYPTWSPDGGQIAFASDRDGNFEIYVMAFDGSNVQRLTNTPGAETMPAWGPNGTQIAFVTDRDGNNEAYIMNRDGSAQVRLTNTFGANSWYPAWAPHAGRVSFTAERAGIGEIYSIAPDGTEVVTLSDLPDHVGRTDWSPDGQWIAFVTTRDGNAEVYIMSDEGEERQRVTEINAADTLPDWRPLQTPCLIITTRVDVPIYVGPGYNRSIFSYLPSSREFLVIGQHAAPDGSLWWEIDKSELDGASGVTSLWINQTDVQAVGGCAVPFSEAPPLIPSTSITPTPPGQWGPCGSCDTCPGPADECVLAPDGQCLWDPRTCGEDDPGEIVTPPPGVTCYTLYANAEPSAAGYVVRSTPNCGRMAYTEGSYASVTAYGQGGCYVSGWDHNCDGASTPGTGGVVESISVTMNRTCTVTAYFTCIG